MARREQLPGRARETYAMRLGEEERQRIRDAATEKGVPMSQYIRTAALAAADSDLKGTQEL